MREYRLDRGRQQYLPSALFELDARQSSTNSVPEPFDMVLTKEERHPLQETLGH